MTDFRFSESSKARAQARTGFRFLCRRGERIIHTARPRQTEVKAVVCMYRLALRPLFLHQRDRSWARSGFSCTGFRHPDLGSFFLRRARANNFESESVKFSLLLHHMTIRFYTEQLISMVDRTEKIKNRRVRQ